MSQIGIFDKPRAVIRETRILECWCPKCHAGQIKTILGETYQNNQPLIESIGKEYKCQNCETVYEIGDFLSVVPQGFFVASRSEASKAKSNNEIEQWLNEPTSKNDSNYDGDAIMKDLELLNRAAELQTKYLEGMLAKINEPSKEENKPEPVVQEPTTFPIVSAEAQNVLKNCTVDGKIIKLPPDQLDRKLYEQVKKSLELIGGKWKGGKVSGFVFQEDPTELLEQVANGKQRNLKKEYQFYATPPELAERMAVMLEMKPDDSKQILEPSAGQGSLVVAVNKVYGPMKVQCYEAMPTNQTILKKIPTIEFLGDDFLQHEGQSFDYIIANPPFTKNQDIDHIRKMYEVLRNGGTMVTLSSPSWQIGSQKKQVEFGKWLKAVGAETEDIPEGAFIASGTSIRTVLIKITKP